MIEKCQYCSEVFHDILFALTITYCVLQSNKIWMRLSRYDDFL
jgi:hypothetical protein